MQASATRTSLQRQIPWGKIFTYIALVVLACIFTIPFLWLVSTSLKDNRELLLFPPPWIPEKLKFSNYMDVFRTIPFFVYAKNSTIYTVSSVIGRTLSCAIVAYGFARLRWFGRDFWFVILLSTMMIPQPVTLVPLFLLFKQFGWIGTLKPLIIPTFFGGPFNVFLLRQFFRGIPMELSEAALVDGAGHWRIFWQIIIPLAKPALLTVAVLQFMTAWNDFMGPLIYLNNQANYTLSIGIQQFQAAYDTQWNLLMAGTVLMVLPMIIVFFIAQRYFIEGIAVTGLKG